MFQVNFISRHGPALVQRCTRCTHIHHKSIRPTLHSQLFPNKNENMARNVRITKGSILYGYSRYIYVVLSFSRKFKSKFAYSFPSSPDSTIPLPSSIRIFTNNNYYYYSQYGVVSYVNNLSIKIMLNSFFFFFFASRG